MGTSVPIFGCVEMNGLLMHESVAVIIPTFNRKHSLGRALDSVYAQSVMPAEICVVDDGSNDGTDEFLRRNYPEVHYIFQANQGVSAARNRGVRSTSSHWLAFLDSDDEWLPPKLELQLTALASDPGYRLVHCDEIWIRCGVRVNPMRKHEKSGGQLFERCLPLCAISPSAVMMERSLLLELGGFDESLPACEDYDLWLKICSRYPVLYIDKALLNKYGGHEDQLSRQHWGMDRFRVKALDNILKSKVLNSEQYRAAKAMLIKKSEILKNGANKRRNKESEMFYQQLIDKYSPSTGASN